MRFLIFLSVLVLLPLVPVVLFLASLSASPAQPISSALSAGELQRARYAVHQIDPQATAVGLSRLGRLTDDDLRVLSRYGLAVFGANATEVRSEPGRLYFGASVELPDWLPRRYLNVSGEMVAADGDPSLDRLAVGHIKIPTVIANGLFQLGLGWIDDRSGERLLERVSIHDGRVDFVYRWSAQTLERLGAQFFADVEPALAKQTHDALGAWAAARGGKTAKLADLLRQLSRQPAVDARKANLALILVVADYVTGRGLARVVPSAKRWPKIPRIRITLRGRVDFAQHYMASAAVAVLGGPRLADAVGLYKEISDSERGSGFSFTDLLADRAGTRFGELATSAERADDMRSKLRNAGATLMPDVRGLPEHMSARTFKSRFGEVGSPRYRRVSEDIERRIAALRLFHFDT